MLDEPSQRLKVLSEVLDELSMYTLEGFRSAQSLDVEVKGHHDYVSGLDRGAEALARKVLAVKCPGEQIVGEEYGGNGDDDYWVIDPIDGTVNFLTGLPLWAVSIGFVKSGKPHIGGIALPALGVMLKGGVGLPLEATDQLPVSLTGANLAFGVGRNPIWSINERGRVEAAIEEKGLHIVTLGSCAASLAMVALGRLAGYVEHEIEMWDCAAGVALCQSSGMQCDITPVEGTARVSVCVSAPEVAQVLL